MRSYAFRPILHPESAAGTGFTLGAAAESEASTESETVKLRKASSGRLLRTLKGHRHGAI